MKWVFKAGVITGVGRLFRRMTAYGDRTKRPASGRRRSAGEYEVQWS